jgi:hypothetical protein
MIDYIKRIRVRLLPLTTVIVSVLPFALEQLGMINFTPLLSQYLGEHWALVLSPLIAIVLASMKSALHVEPLED